MNIEIELIFTLALQVAEYEVTTFSMLYNNPLALVIRVSFYILNVCNRFTRTNFIQFCPLSGDFSQHELYPQYWAVALLAVPSKYSPTAHHVLPATPMTGFNKSKEDFIWIISTDKKSDARGELYHCLLKMSGWLAKNPSLS